MLRFEAALGVVFLATLLMLCQEAEAGCSVINLKFTGGDGFVPILGNDNKIYNTYHHQAARVQCVDPATGDFCTGSPSDGILLTPLLQALNWPALTGIPGAALADTLVQSNYNGVMFRCQDPLRDECAHYLNPITFIMADTRIFFGVSCYDTKNHRLCSGAEVTILNPASVYVHVPAPGPGPVIPNGGIQSFVPYNNKAYSFDYGMNLLCYDLVTSKSCPGFPRSYASILPAVNPTLGSGESLATLRYLNYNGRPSLYVAVAGGGIPGSPTPAVRFTCFELVSGNFGICPEFFGQAYDLVPTGAGYVFEFFFDYDKSGNPTAICLFSYAVDYSLASCRSLANPSVAPASSNLAAIMAHSSNLGMVNQLTIDNRMYWGTFSLNNMFCFDFSLGAACPNFPISEYNRTGAVTRDYGVAKDPNGNCFFALGDASNLYSFDAEGHLPCVANVVQPNAVDDSYYFTSYNTVILDVLANDSEFNPPSFAITVASASPNIAIVNGKIQFTPTQPIDSFTYRICSVGFGPSSDTATVIVKACLDEGDSDGDGVKNCFDLDDDNDGILDTDEGTGNFDGDAFIDAFDLDSDGDGIFDLIENIANGPALPNTLNLITASGYSLDLNNDGRLDGTGASYQATLIDVGANGILDKIETSLDSGILISQLSHPNTDGTDNPDYLDTDSDDDTILDSVEKNVDSDGDKIPDFRDLDSNNDGIPDNTPGGTSDPDGDGVPNYLDLDSDNDGILDSVEGIGNPDGDSFPNYLDLDSDGDGIFDLIENIANGPSLPNTLNLVTSSGYFLDLNNDGRLDGTGASNQAIAADVGKNGVVNRVETSVDSGVLISQLSHPNTDSDSNPDFLDTDSDDDTILDSVEKNVDSDGDKIPDFRDLDSNNDGIPDNTPGGTSDPDGDGVPNYLDLDSDNDGILNSVEGTSDADNDLILNYLDLDSDGDGIFDLIENIANGPSLPNTLNLVTASGYSLDLNNDGRLDGTGASYQAIAADVGKNGVVNRVETSVDSGVLISQLSHPNTDSDSNPDFLDTDSDGDTVLDSAEGNNDNDGDSLPNFRELDSDNDGILDSIEKNIDSDGDGVPNFLDLDSDNDGTSDLMESGSFNPQDRDHFTGADSDKDGLVNEVDQAPSAFRGPANFVVLDTDRDGTPDYLEVDSDNDGIFDADEKSNLPPSYINSSTGRVVGPDTDGDGIVNIIDDCTCFGGLTARKFTVISPTSAAWLMYASKEISWKHNLYADYTALKIDLVNIKTGARKAIRDQYPIGSDPSETQSILYRMSGVALGAYKISFGVYTSSGSFIPDRFSSPVFNVKT